MKSFGLAALLCAAVASGGALAQEARIAHVNLNRVINESKPGKEAVQRIEKEFAAREQELKVQSDMVRDAAAALEKDGPKLKEAERQSRQRELANMQRDYQAKRQKYQQDLAQRRSDEVNKVAQQAADAIKAVAEREKYDYVLQNPAYGTPRHDITDKVIQALSK